MTINIIFPILIGLCLLLALFSGDKKKGPIDQVQVTETQLDPLSTTPANSYDLAYEADKAAREYSNQRLAQEDQDRTGQARAAFDRALKTRADNTICAPWETDADKAKTDYLHGRIGTQELAQRVGVDPEPYTPTVDPSPMPDVTPAQRAQALVDNTADRAEWQTRLETAKKNPVYINGDRQIPRPRSSAYERGYYK